MKIAFYLFGLMGLLLLSCGDDDDELANPTQYDIRYRVTASGGATVSRIEYLDESAERVVILNPTLPWEKSLRIRGGLALEAVAFGDVPFDGEMIIQANWSPAIDGQTAESENLKNTEPNTVITNGRVDIDGRTLPR